LDFAFNNEGVDDSSLDAVGEKKTEALLIAK